MLPLGENRAGGPVAHPRRFRFALGDFPQPERART
jgi:hypothetical protein